jgi:hypothetical protein
MAAPHVTGVAALVVSQRGETDPQHPMQLAMAPEAVERALTASAREIACPVPPVLTAPCEGTASFNGHYGNGVVDAVAALNQAGAP